MDDPKFIYKAEKHYTEDINDLIEKGGAGSGIRGHQTPKEKSSATRRRAADADQREAGVTGMKAEPAYEKAKTEASSLSASELRSQLKTHHVKAGLTYPPLEEYEKRPDQDIKSSWIHLRASELMWDQTSKGLPK